MWYARATCSFSQCHCFTVPECGINQEFLLATCGAGCVRPQTGRQQDGQLAEMPDPDCLCLVSLVH